MSVTNVNSQTNTPSTSSAGNSSLSSGINASNFTSNLNDFLTLLTTQLTHQDPLSPMDSTQFTQQLVGFSQVEQQIQTNTNLTNLISLQQGSQSTTAISYIGTVVEANGGSLPLVNGKASFSYTLPSAAKSVTVTIKDQNGNVVDTVSGTANSGKNIVTWDGKDSSGSQLADGDYSFTVAATDSSGNAITPTATTFFGQVIGVTGMNSSSSNSSSSSSSNNNAVTLNVNGVPVALSSIVSVMAPTGSNSNNTSSGA